MPNLAAFRSKCLQSFKVSRYSPHVIVSWPRDNCLSRRISSSASPASQDISNVARNEGGTAKDSKSAQMQSELTKARNLKSASEQVEAQMSQNSASVSSNDAHLLQSRTARAQGTAQPSGDSLAAKAQRLATDNERGSSTAIPTDARQQGQSIKQANFEEQAHRVSSKLSQDPQAVTKEDADIMHRREQRATGTTEKGGVTSQAHSQAAENMGHKK